ncbi:MAG: inositol monophosphatase family protein [Thermoplasmata archaeon]
MDDLTNSFVDLGKDIMESISSMSESRSMSESVGMGSDGTPTKLVDKISEDIVIRHFEDFDLPFNIISEEAGFISRGYSENAVIDPIDGTTNFTAGIPMYSISIAVMNENFDSLRYGFIMNLANGDFYHAVKDRGMYFNGKRMVRRAHGNGIFLASMNGGLDSMTSVLLKRARKVRALGCSSMELALVAAGSADVAIHLGLGNEIRNVDIAAGVVMVREAGGEVVDEHGKKINFGKLTSDRKNMVGYRESRIVEGIF